MPDWKHPFDPHYPPPGPQPGGPYPPPPPGPMPVPPDAPRFLAPGGPPPYPLMPPAPSVVEGESLYEAVNDLTDRVNVCINTYNDVMAECYKTLANLQRAAEENGAYYGPSEVWVEEGYDADSAAAYSVIHKRAVDRRGEPIIMQLGLAYDNASNSKIEQSIFSASKIKFADKIVVAQPKTADGWYGKAIWHGSPIQSAVKGDLWTVGFTRNGIMRVYSNGTGVDQMIRDTVVDAMGVSGVVIQDGAITSETYYQNIPNYDVQCARVLMGQNTNTGEVMILTTGAENDVNRKGMTTVAAANLLLQRGCNIAVELCEGADAGACDKGSMMFIPDNDTVPTAYCFWYISRRRFYKNDYERELAMLTQNYGQCIWDGYLNARNIQNFSDKLAEEIERAQNAENNLDQKITTETERAKAAEAALDAKIEAETNRAEAEEARLDAKIDAETERAEGVEADLQAQITAEVARATGEEERIEGKLDDEIERAKSAESAIQTALNDEINRAKLEEQRLDGAIKTEEQARKDEDARLNTAIQNEQQAREDADTALGGRIDDLSSDVTQQITDFKTEVNGKLDSMESTISQMQTTVGSLTTQVDNLSQNVTNLSGAVSTMQNTVNTLQQNFTSLTEAVAGINDELDKIQSGELVLPYLKNTGDTGTGTYNFTGAVVNVAAPTEDSNAATKKYVDDINTTLSAAIDTEEQRATEAEDALGERIDSEAEARADEDATLNAAIEEVKGQVENLTDGTTVLPYVKKAGDTMSGALNMGNYSVTDAYAIQLYGNNPSAFISNEGEAAIASIATRQNYKVLNVATPVKNTHAATKKYVDDADDVLNTAIQKEVQDRKTAIEGIQTEIDGVTGDLSGYLPLTGGTMTGVLNVQTPTEDANAATKAYVDQAVQNATDPELTDRVEALETSQTQQDTEIANLKNGTTELPYLPLSGGNLSGDLSINGTPVATDSDLDNYVPKSGGTITGPIYYSGEPSQSSELVNKAYVDAHAEMSKNEDDIYILTAYFSGGSGTSNDKDTFAWYKPNATFQFGTITIAGVSSVTSPATPTSCKLYAQNQGSTGANLTTIVTIYKFVADGEQPEPVAPTYDELNLTVLTKTTNGETTASDHDAAMAAMEAAASGAFHYKLNGDVYVISSTALNDSSAKAENVYYCVGEKWYDGTNTLVFESSDYSSNAYWTTNTTSVLNYDASTDYTGADALKNLIQNHYTDTTYHYKLTNGSYTPIYICTNTKIDANTISADNSYFVLTSPNNVVYAGSVKFKEQSIESKFTLVEGIKYTTNMASNPLQHDNFEAALEYTYNASANNYKVKTDMVSPAYIYITTNNTINDSTTETEGTFVFENQSESNVGSIYFTKV